MKNLYDFIVSLCKNRDMKLEELQRKLDTSRTTLYRYMKGINRITPELENCFVEALNMDRQEALEFSKFVSQSAFDQSLIESRYVLDDFLFGNRFDRKTAVDVDMVFYNNDKYLRTLKEVLDFILSFCGQEGLTGSIKVMNCLDENIYIHLEDFLKRVFAGGTRLEVEHFVSLSERDYQQNAYSFIRIFPLMKYEPYRLYVREQDTDDALMHDSFLIALNYAEEGKPSRRFFSASFYEEGMPECITFADRYMYGFLSKRYESLKRGYKNVIQKYDALDFNDDISSEISKRGESYLIKPNPCYDKIPYEAYMNMIRRADREEIKKFTSAVYGQELKREAVMPALETAMEYIRTRIEYSRTNMQIDVYSADGMLDFIKTGRITDHLEYLPSFNREEVRMILEYLHRRSSDPDDSYRLYITEREFFHKDMIIIAGKDYGVAIEYIYPGSASGLWKTLFIENKRLASIFCDYIENHIPVSHAMAKEETGRFLQSLLDRLQ